MKQLTVGIVVTLLVTVAVRAQTNSALPTRPAQPPITTVQTTNYLGLITNGPAVARAYQIISVSSPAPLDPRLATNAAFMKLRTSTFTWTNAVFDRFLPESLHYTIWTNFLATTNGRNLRIWSQRLRPASWPTNPPALRWNTNSVLWGMKGFTAICPSWSAEGNPGQVPLTALTRRHVYSRGHGFGPEGFSDLLAGKKAWFLTRNNELIERVVKQHVIRTKAGTNGVHRDYTILILDRDLPESIEPLRVVEMAEVQSRYPIPRHTVLWPQPIYQTEQGGNVSTGVAPLVVNTWKPGDSGSPNLIPLPGELIFYSGRSTSGLSPAMQEDMDALCRLERLDPAKYQMQAVDWSGYPSY